MLRCARSSARARVVASLASCLAAASLLLPTLAANPASAAGTGGIAGGSDGAVRTYIVVLRQAPTASYDGGIHGLARTAPRPGQRFDRDRAAVTAYRAHLLRGQRAVLASIGNPAVLYSYTTALDGFAARLSDSQAARAAASHRVLEVRPDAMAQPESLGRSARATAVHNAAGSSAKGRGVVIGEVDSGVWPTSPSLAGIPTSPAALQHRYPGFHGVCRAGRGWTTGTCNSKVIAARYFVRGFGPDHVASSDYLSPRDGLGHGTSVAAVAAGNPGIQATVGGQSLGTISGLAPEAALSVYKACWTSPEPSGDGCDTADTLAAIDRAVSDGVDVLCYAISGTGGSLASPVDLAFLNAAAANVFVATPAGNGGPTPGSVEQTAPWVTTVAATTHAVYQGGVRLGDGREFIGAMLSDHAVGPARLVYAADAAAPGVPRNRAALCYAGSLAATIVDQAIVVCDRGVTARVSKSAAVKQAGGIGMVLVNTGPDELDADAHFVPTVHLDATSGKAVIDYAEQAGASATAALLPDATDHPPVPSIARFSGRGPSSVLSGDLLKPDLAAPGVTVASAVAPPEDSGRRFDVSSGTSLAAAFVAGLAADVESAHPTWTPGTVQSALMTTAGPVYGRDSGPLQRGAGEADPARATDPGLAYESGLPGWAALLGASVAGVVGWGAPAKLANATALNSASISVADLVGTARVARTVTNVGSRTATYHARLRGLAGIAASVSPGTLTLRPGQSRRFTIAFTADRGAHYGAFSGGSLVWSDGTGPGAGHVVSSPIVVRPQIAQVPRAESGHGGSGAVTVRGTAGVTGTIAPSTTGLTGTTPVALRLRPSTFDASQPQTSPGTAEQTLTMPTGSPAARFQVDAKRASAVLSLHVYRADKLVASAAGSGTATLLLRDPQPGRYRVFVTAGPTAGHAKAGSARAVTARLSTWVLPRSPADNLTLTPGGTPMLGGDAFEVRASWHGLPAGQRWFGLITWPGLSATTTVTVN